MPKPKETFDPEFFFPADKINADAATDSQLLQAARVTAHWRAGDMRVMPDFSDKPAIRRSQAEQPVLRLLRFD